LPQPPEPERDPFSGAHWDENALPSDSDGEDIEILDKRTRDLKLEAISVHKANEFRVWDDKSGKPVRCKYDPATQEERIKSLLRSKVAVFGTVQSNSNGIPISLEVEDIEPAEQRALPTIQEMSGSIKGITEGKSLKEYLEQIDDDC